MGSSSELTEKSFNEYDDSDFEEDFDKNMLSTEFAMCKLDTEKQPVRKKINEIAHIQVKAKLSSRKIKELIPIINSSPGVSIEIPTDRRIFKQQVNKCFEPKFYTNCSTCNELNECPGLCVKCKKKVEKKRDEFFAYIPIEYQIKKSLMDNFDEICEYLMRVEIGELTDIDDGEIQKKAKENYANSDEKKILSLTLNTDGGQIANNSTRSLWPVQLYQNYLPPEKRFSTENILVVCVYYGEKKTKFIRSNVSFAT